MAKSDATALDQFTYAVDHTYSFLAFLEREGADQTGKRKGERTKSRIVKSTAELLETQGFRGLTHNHICSASGIGVATFYLYFQNKTVACEHVLSRFLEFCNTLQAPHWSDAAIRARSDQDPYGSFFLATLQILKIAKANRGLFRCLLQFNGESDAVSKIWRISSIDLAARSAKRAARAGSQLSQAMLELRANLMSGMVDDFARNYIIGDDAILNAQVDAACGSDGQLALLISDIWYRTLLDRDPPSDRSKWLGDVGED